jgi:carboxypeptidase family protein
MHRIVAYVCLAVLVLPISSLAQQQRITRTTNAPSTPAAETSPDNLPVCRVVLYKNGVGYFEHLGRVRGTQDVHIDFTSGQLNDALASLTVLDLGGGRISGVSYNSTAPFEKRLGTLRLPLGEKVTASQFLDALRGARLEVRRGAAGITGRLLSVERKTRTAGGTTLEVDVVSLLTDGGEIREAEITPAMSVRLTDTSLQSETKRYLSLLASEREQDLRRMTLSANGAGDRQLFVSYISEVPIWKTTYRLVLPEGADKKPLLQGWAIVDNTVGEDRNDVELSLVAGAPQSFIQQLSQPYYSRRAVVPLPEEMARAPQTHQATLIGGAQLAGLVVDPSGAVISGARVRVLGTNGAEVAEMTTGNDGEYRFSNLPDGTYQVQFTQNGFQTTTMGNAQVHGDLVTRQDVTLRVGSMSETVEVTASAPEVNMTASSLGRLAGGGSLGSGGALGLGQGSGVGGGTGGGMFRSGAVNTQDRPLGGREYSNLAMLQPGVSMSNLLQGSTPASAEGQELGDLFEYKLKDRVTIRKNQSAMVPILQTEINAEKVSLWNASLNSIRPLRGVWLTNSSSETLDGGNFSVLEDNIFAGQGLLDPIKPGERRILSYATDLAMLVRSSGSNQPQHFVRVRIVHGVMIRTSEQREYKTYTVRNEDTSPRTLILEYAERPGWKLSADAPKPEEISTGFYRFRMRVAPKQTAVLEFAETRPEETRYELTNVNSDQVALFVREKSINPEIEAALRGMLEQKEQVAAIDTEAEKRDGEISSIYDDQQRLRENLKALKGSPEEKALTQRYTQQLSEQETRLESLRKEKMGLEKKSEAARQQLDKMIEALAFDVNL